MKNQNFFPIISFFLFIGIMITARQSAFQRTGDNSKNQYFLKPDKTEVDWIKKEEPRLFFLNRMARSTGKNNRRKTSPDAIKQKINRTRPFIVNHINTDKKIVALTFDADMTYNMEYSLHSGKIKSWYNEKLISELEKSQTPATLFLTGLWIKNYPEITKKLAQDPLFEVANHSYSHPAFALPCFNLGAIPNALDEEEIVKTDDLLKLYAPNYKKYFRFPGLCHSNRALENAGKLGYKIIHGDVIGSDGFTDNTAGIISRVVSRVKPGSIIILHMHGAPNAPKTAEAVPEIIRQLKEKGYVFVKISAMLGEK